MAISQISRKGARRPGFGKRFIFQFMTNNAYLYSIGPSIAHVLEQDYQQLLLCKLAELQDLALEAKFVFKGDLGKSLSSFIDSYHSLLFSMYQYQIALKLESPSTRLSRSCRR